MFVYIIKRLIEVIPVLFVVSLLLFMFVKLMPGDPAITYAGEDASLEDISAARELLGLDKPISTQYINWLTDVLQGDFGTSFRSKEAVNKSIAQAFTPTLYLALAGFAWSVVLGLLFGIFAALKRGKWQDWTLMSASIAGISMPSFWLGLLLIQFVAVPFDFFSVSGFSKPTDLILPAITLGSSVAAVTARFTRSAFLEVYHEDYIRTARAKGLKDKVIVWKHAFRNALIPVLTMLGLQFGFLLSGSIVIEVVFGWPGLGLLLIDSIKFQDQPMIQAIVLLMVFEFVLINLLIDILYCVVNPNIRLAK